MWYKTDLMEQILTSESAKQMIDYVSPIYGEIKNRTLAVPSDRT